MIDQTRASWAAITPERREQYRAQQIAMVENTLQDIAQRLEQDEATKKGCWPIRRSMLDTQAAYLEMLKRLTGTEKPAEVTVNMNVDLKVTGVLVQAISSMTPEQLSDALMQAQEDERFAKEYRQLQAKTIDTQGEAAE